jgi:hypothetical protein
MQKHQTAALEVSVREAAAVPSAIEARSPSPGNHSRSGKAISLPFTTTITILFSLLSLVLVQNGQFLVSWLQLTLERYEVYELLH